MDVGCNILLFLLMLHTCLATEIPNCNFEDTVDLTGAHKFENGSYLYDGHLLISPDQVGTYDYEILSDGDRVTLPSHVRGCACKDRLCMRFCCDPTTQTFAEETRDCVKLTERATFDPYVNVISHNGTMTRQHAINDYTIRRGAPCSVRIPTNRNFSKIAEWTIYENGSLLLRALIQEVHKTHQFDKNLYCLHVKEFLEDNKTELIPDLCYSQQISVEHKLTYIATTISVPFLLLTLLVYACIPELQNLHGKCFMCYVASLAACYITLIPLTLGSNTTKVDIATTNWCTILGEGYSAYFVFLCVFFWLNTISFDLWQSFRRTSSFRSTQNRRFLYYSAYGFGVPLCLTIIAIVIDKADISPLLQPGIAVNCWIETSQWSAMLYLYGINIAIIVADLVFFALTAHKIFTMKKDIKKVMSRGDSRKNNKTQQDRQSFGLFLRLFIIMGLQWTFDVISYVDKMINPNFDNPLYIVTDILNGLIGPFIFVLFILNRKVLGLIKKRYKRMRGISANSQTEEETTVNLTDEPQSNSVRKN